jgi:hypothetical protein
VEWCVTAVSEGILPSGENGEHMETRIALTYHGSALMDGAMDARQAAKNMVAFADFMTAAVKIIYGEQTDAKSEVTGFQKGSFETDFIFTVAGPAASLLTALSPEQLWDAIKRAFDLWRFLKGKPPEKVVQQGTTVTIENIKGDVTQVNGNVYNIVMAKTTTEAVETFVRDALAQSGVGAISIARQDDKTIDQIQVNNNESMFFTQVSPEQELTQNRVRMILHIVAAVFQDGNKWRFTDGSGSPFSAAILDQEFVAKVNAGERFGKGDALDVEMELVQTVQNGRINIERRVLKVLRHISPNQQLTLA